MLEERFGKRIADGFVVTVGLCIAILLLAAVYSTVVRPTAKALADLVKGNLDWDAAAREVLAALAVWGLSVIILVVGGRFLERRSIRRIEAHIMEAEDKTRAAIESAKAASGETQALLDEVVKVRDEAKRLLQIEGESSSDREMLD